MYYVFKLSVLETTEIYTLKTHYAHTQTHFCIVHNYEQLYPGIRACEVKSGYEKTVSHSSSSCLFINKTGASHSFYAIKSRAQKSIFSWCHWHFFTAMYWHTIQTTQTTQQSELRNGIYTVTGIYGFVKKLRECLFIWNF